MGEDEDREAEEDDLSGRTQADCGGSAGTVGEGEERGVRQTESGRSDTSRLVRRPDLPFTGPRW